MTEATSPGSGRGRSHLRSNLLASWSAHAVAVVIGFVMPRLIFESVGQHALGVWDLAWSLVSFFAYTGIGAASAVSHFVARSLAGDNPQRARRTTSTAFYLQLALAAALGGTVALTVGVLPGTMSEFPGALRADLPWIGVWSGIAVALTILGDTSQGVLSGSHRNDINDLLAMAHDVVLALAMAAAMLTGRGILGLAVSAAGCRLLLEIARLGIAVRVCPSLSCRWSDLDPTMARAILRFGTKTLVSALQELLTYQTARLMLFASLGAPALAVFSRYFTLTRQIPRLVDRLTLVVPPLASELAGLGEFDRLRQLTLRTASVTVMLGMPFCLLIAVFGDHLVLLWMGPEFVAPGLSWVLATMVLLHLDRGVATRVLSGMNAHGRIALTCWFISVPLFGVCWWLLHPLNPFRTALLVGVTMSVGVSIPHFLLSCSRLGIGYFEYALKVYAKPLFINALFFASLIMTRHIWETGSVALAAAAICVSVAGLSTLYWRVAFDERLRNYVRGRLAFDTV